MRIIRNITAAILLSFVALLAGGCMEEELDIVHFKNYDPSEVICFSAEMTGNAVVSRGALGHLEIEDENWEVENVDVAGTKSAPVTELSGNAGVTAIKFSGDWATSAGNITSADAVYTDMQNDKFTFGDGGALSPTSPRAWRNVAAEHNVKFFAYAPWCDQKGTPEIQLSATGSAIVPYLTYTANSTVTSQKDLLYAVSGTISGSSKTSVPLTFRHALSAVQFKIGFACKVQSLTVHNVYTSGTFSLNESDFSWSNFGTKNDFTFDIGDTQARDAGATLVDGENTLMMIPQTFTNAGSSFQFDKDAYIELVYGESGATKTIIAPLGGTAWEKGRKIIYTLYESEAPSVSYIYMDLAAGSVSITSTTYSGKVFVNGTAQTVSGDHKDGNKYYVYQSNTTDADSDFYQTKTGYASALNSGACRIPNYPEMTYGGKKWGDYITNNKDVEHIIPNWETYAGDAERTATSNTISFSAGEYICYMVLDNLWSSDEQFSSSGRTTGPINLGSGSKKQVTLALKGDNRFANIFYNNSTKGSSGYLKFTSYKGDGYNDGSITVAPLNQNIKFSQSSHNCYSVIGGGGGSDSEQETHNILFYGGTVFSGFPKSNNCIQSTGDCWIWTSIGSSNNEPCTIKIAGGRVTSVSYSTSAAIGGGGGITKGAGGGDITITGGEVYAYAQGVYITDHKMFVPGCAIGGGSSGKEATNESSTINISGGYVYAESVGGNGIGGCNGAEESGGNATVNITGGTVISKSVSGNISGKFGNTEYNIDVDPGSSIGGGFGGQFAGSNGGNAVVTISGNASVTAGSIGGGKTNNSTGKIGTAQITIEGNPVISGQFIMAAGASETPTFTMTGGTIKNSSTTDDVYHKVQTNGGAVYMEAGTCNISGGTISGCSATNGGAVYMKSTTIGKSTYNPTCNISGTATLQSNSASLGGAVYVEGGDLNMSGGTLIQNSSESDGGAVYVSNGDVTMTGGTIERNLTMDGNGGGICLVGGSFTMNGDESNTEIINNTANFSNVSPYTGKGGNGGGIYLASETSDPLVDIRRGTIQANSADYNGGGIFVDMSQEGNTHTARVNIGTESGTHSNKSPYIYQNTAGLSGGGMSVQGSGSDIYIYSGTVNGNVSAYVLNPDIRNDGGTMHLIGNADETDVNFVTITFHGNNDTDPEDTATQRVVTNTNSLLVPPTTAFTFEFCHQTGWNTDRYGKGDEYTLDGKQVKKAGTSEYVDAVMNISTNIDLFAQWADN